MRMIPSVTGPATNRGAERLLFAALSPLDAPGWTAFHSLDVSEHEHKRWGELDFVLLSKEALLVIEVKGGGVSCRRYNGDDRQGVRLFRSTRAPSTNGRCRA